MSVVVFRRKECPTCKKEAWLMRSIVEQEIRKGNLGKDVLACTRAEICAVIDARRPAIVGGRVPGARILHDVCTECGEECITFIETGHITLSTDPRLPPTFA